MQVYTNQMYYVPQPWLNVTKSPASLFKTCKLVVQTSQKSLGSKFRSGQEPRALHYLALGSSRSGSSLSILRRKNLIKNLKSWDNSGHFEGLQSSLQLYWFKSYKKFVSPSRVRKLPRETLLNTFGLGALRMS